MQQKRYFLGFLAIVFTFFLVLATPQAAILQHLSFSGASAHDIFISKLLCFSDILTKKTVVVFRFHSVALRFLVSDLFFLYYLFHSYFEFQIHLPANTI